MKVVDGFGAIIAFEMRNHLLLKMKITKLTRIWMLPANKRKTLKKYIMTGRYCSGLYDEVENTGRKSLKLMVIHFEGPAIATYNQGKNFLCTMVALSKEVIRKGL